MICEILDQCRISYERYEKVCIGRSKNTVYRIVTKEEVYYCKYGSYDIVNLIDILKQIHNATLPITVSNIKCSGMIEDTYYVLMDEVRGEMLFDDIFLKTPEETIALFAKGLKQLHRLPIENISTIYTKSTLLKQAFYNLNNHISLPVKKQIRYDLNKMELDIRIDNYDMLGGMEVYNYISKISFHEDLVFTHGDYTLSNVICNNKEIGYIDLDRAGISDRYRDIPISLQNIEAVFNTKKYHDIFIKNYGIEFLDNRKLDFFTNLEKLL